MTVYRVKQFIRAITAKINEDDIKFINKYLTKDERNLFLKLKIYDQKHSINVAKSIEEYLLKGKEKINIDKKELIKAGLLHDIGKLKKSLNPVEKSILVVLNKVTKGGLKKLDNIASINIYYNHGLEGYKILKKNNYSKEFLILVKDHHNYKIKNRSIEILRECDDNN